MPPKPLLHSQFPGQLTLGSGAEAAPRKGPTPAKRRHRDARPPPNSGHRHRNRSASWAPEERDSAGPPPEGRAHPGARPLAGPSPVLLLCHLPAPACRPLPCSAASPLARAGRTYGRRGAQRILGVQGAETRDCPQPETRYVTGWGPQPRRRRWPTALPPPAPERRHSLEAHWPLRHTTPPGVTPSTPF